MNTICGSSLASFDPDNRCSTITNLVEEFKLPRRSKKKWAIYLALLFVLGGAVGSFSLQNTLSKDLTQLNYSHDRYSFEATRDPTGVWQIKARDEVSLFFAWGYLQSLDREFQLTLFWHIALGKLSELVGASQLSRDHMMRMSSQLGKWDYEHLEPNSLTKRAADAFVLGRNEFLDQAPTNEPIEYRLMGLSRKTLARWEPWQILAIIRFHTSEFSYDFNQESKWVELNELFGSAMTRFLMPTEEVHNLSVYDQPTVEQWVKTKIPSSKKIPIPLPFFPSLNSASLPPKDSSSRMANNSLDFSLNLLDSAPDFFDKGTSEGASNAWLIADPQQKRLPTLCNDPHLGFSWPSPLYPTRYKIENLQVDGQGFMLPGVPAAVIGAVTQLQKNNSIAWGITMASYADTQDLIELSSQTLASGVSQEEIFRIKDPTSQKWSEEKFTNTWTKYGPRVDEAYNFGPKKPSKALALDWLGYRKIPTLAEFFLRRNLYAQEGLFDELSQSWTYPSVNFTWIERSSQKVHFGHAMTGLTFSRSTRSTTPFVLSESEAKARKYSQPSERPFFYKEYKSAEKTFLVTANHKIFKEPLSAQIASDWVDNNRAEQILSQENHIFRTPEFGQTDFNSRSLKQFLKGHLPLINSTNACPSVPTESIICQEILSALATYNGDTQAKMWEPYLAFLWYVKLKENLWPIDFASKSPAHESTLSSWIRGSSSARLVNRLSIDPAEQTRWEKLSKLNYQQMAEKSFHQAYDLLAKQYTDPRKAKWGDGHTIMWQHLFSLAPPPVGPILAAQLLGRESVSGGLDSPGRFDFMWKPSRPLELSATHGEAARFCVEVAPNEERLHPRWSIPTGVSGNPFSKWSQVMPRQYFFKNKLFEISDEK